MAEWRPQPSTRVFINNLDAYSSKGIAKLLASCVVGMSLGAGGETETVEDGEGPAQPPPDQLKEGTFQIVGTVSKQTEEIMPFVLKKYFNLNKEQLLGRLMQCDVIIYNISQNAHQMEEAAWAITALHGAMEKFCRPKMFILVSTVMTWALTKLIDPDDPEIPFTDEDYRRRRAHPNFRRHLDLEKLVVKMGKMNRALLSTYAVASGLQYGFGEQVFHLFFKMSWVGQAKVIPVFGEGANVVPTIHINDLARVIQNVIDQKPKPCYLLAVDNSKNTTLKDIVKTIASVIGPGKIEEVPLEEVFLMEDLTQTEIDSMSVNLCMEATYIKELFSIDWECMTGLVENIQLVVDEYKQTRGLLPVRICVLGPPAVGKTTLAERICRHYRLHHIKIKDTVAEAVAQLEETVKVEDQDQGENEDSVAEAQAFLDSIKENMEQNEGRLDDQLLVRVIKEKLKSKPCNNQGFVLDGFPKSYEQAKELFSSEREVSQDYRIPKKIIPDLFFCLEASDAYLKERVLNLPESLVEGTSYSHDHFLGRLARYRENNGEDETVLNYLDEQEIIPHHIEIAGTDDPEYLLPTQRVIEEVGHPRNYGPTSQEVEEEERRKAEERMRCEAQERKELERREMEEAKERATRWGKWSKHLDKVNEQEEEILKVQSLPMRSYLMKTIMPTLTKGLIECCTVRPPDPLDFLAEYLFMNNPLND